MIMNTMVQHKQQNKFLEENFSILTNMVNNLSKGSHSTTSNHRLSMNSIQEDLKEEYIVHQMKEDMDLSNYDCHLSGIGQDEANKNHIFH
jgi:hypothetical protein